MKIKKDENKALILGVGNAQLDVIRYLKSCGWWVLACSSQYNEHVIKFVDRFELIDIRDVGLLEELARSECIHLVYSIGSDIAVPSITMIASNLGLPTFVNLKTSQIMSNKLLLRDLLKAHNLSPIRYKKICTKDDIIGWDIFPCIVKPVDSQGQRGVYIAKSFQEIEAGLMGSLNFSESKSLIVEEYLDGPEISINAFVFNSHVVFYQLTDRLVVENCHAGIPRAHRIPATSGSDRQLAQAAELMKSCVKALDIKNGPIYFQIKLTSNGPKIIEITPRLDGCHLWRLIKYSSGFDLLGTSLNLLTTGNYLKPKRKINNSFYRLEFFLCPPGRVFRREEYNEKENTVYAEFYYRDGDVVKNINNVMEKVGYQIVKA